MSFGQTQQQRTDSLFLRWLQLRRQNSEERCCFEAICLNSAEFYARQEIYESIIVDRAKRRVISNCSMKWPYSSSLSVSVCSPNLHYLLTKGTHLLQGHYLIAKFSSFERSSAGHMKVFFSKPHWLTQLYLMPCSKFLSCSKTAETFSSMLFQLTDSLKDDSICLHR